MNSLAAVSVAVNFANADSMRLRGTTIGTTDIRVVSANTSAVPRSSAPAYRPASGSMSARTPPTSTARTRARAAAIVMIRRRRSTRSASAPAGSENNSQGRVLARVTPATSAGESVIETATRGRVSLTTPSARLVTAAPAHRAMKFRAPTVVGSLGWVSLCIARRLQ
jgi:hypothetical protein